MRAHRWVVTAAAALAATLGYAPVASAADTTTTLQTPQNVRVVSNTAEAVTLAWDPVPEVGGGGIYYERYSDENTYPSWVPTETEKINRNDIVGLEPGTTHTFRIRAGDPSGNLSEFTSITVTWADGDVTPPTTPTNLRVVRQDETGAQLAWDPSTDDSGRLFYVINLGTVSFELGDEPGFFVPADDPWIGTGPGSSVTASVHANDFTRWNPSGSSNAVTVTF